MSKFFFPEKPWWKKTQKEAIQKSQKFFQTKTEVKGTLWSNDFFEQKIAVPKNRGYFS